MVVVAPAGGGAVRQQGTRMAGAGGDVGDSFAGQRTTSDSDRRVSTSRRKSLVLVVAPAGDGAV